MPFPTASRPIVRWLLVAVLAAVIAGLYLQSREDDWTCEDRLDHLAGVHEMEHKVRFFDLLQDRATRWLADHPDRACPRIEDLAHPREWIETGMSTINFMCGDREHFGRRVVLTTSEPLVNWPDIQAMRD